MNEADAPNSFLDSRRYTRTIVDPRYTRFSEPNQTKRKPTLSATRIHLLVRSFVRSMIFFSFYWILPDHTHMQSTSTPDLLAFISSHFAISFSLVLFVFTQALSIFECHQPLFVYYSY